MDDYLAKPFVEALLLERHSQQCKKEKRSYF